jgi:hypothetical protein
MAMFTRRPLASDGTNAADGADHGIFARSNCFEVLWIDARSVAAQMVNLQSGGNFTDKNLVGYAMWVFIV